MVTVEKAMEGVPTYTAMTRVPDPEEWIPQVVSWEPMNVESVGPVVHVIEENGSQLRIPLSSKSMCVLQCRYYHIDLQALRHRYWQYLRRHLNVPIVLPARKLVFIAVKTRNTFNRNENASGYVANTAIQQLVPISPTKTEIHLKNGCSIEALLSERTLHDRITWGEQFANKLRENNII